MAFNGEQVKRSLDDSSVIDQIEAYRLAVASGQTPDRAPILSRFPDLADQLNACLNVIELVAPLANEFREHSFHHSSSQDLPSGYAPPQLTNLGDFRLVRQIGQGGMGVVYEAEQLSLSRRVAVKVLPFASLWPESVLERFRQEVRIAASLEHPHMLQIYGYGCEHGVHFYSMKLVDGGSLADVIRQRRSQSSAIHSATPVTTRRVSDQTTPGLAEDAIATRRVSEEATPGLSDKILSTQFDSEDSGPGFIFASSHESWAKLALAAAEALAYAHQRGVIHRDIKPSNLLLDSQGKLFVADFGLARADTDINLTRTGELLGTPRYMSPEQAAGRLGAIDARTDIYSLGATLYELITLQPVVRAVNRAAALHELQHLRVIPPRQHDANIPPPLEQIVLKCLQPDPRDRYRSADDLADDLRRFLDGRAVVAGSPGLVRRASRYVHAHPRSALGVVAVLALCVLIPGIFWFADGGHPSLTSRGPPQESGFENSAATAQPLTKNSFLESPDMLRSSPAKNKNTQARSPAQRRLLVEALEDRKLLAVVSFWSAENTAIDSISGNDGTHYNGATYSAGQVGDAFSFDGMDDRISIPDSLSFKLTESLSIEGWIKVNGFPSGALNGHGIILFRGDDRGGLDPYQLRVDPNGEITFQISSLTGSTRLSAPIATGQFVHVAAVLDNDDGVGRMKLYQNGALVIQQFTDVRPFADLDPTMNPGVGIGNHGGYPGTPHNFPFNGQIDELKLYDHALTATEVRANFNATKGPSVVSVSDASAIEGSSVLKVLDRFVNMNTAGLERPRTPLFGPDGNGDGAQDLYVTSTDTNQVLRFDGKSGAAIDVFVEPGEDGLLNPADIAFGPDGSLYVSSLGYPSGAPAVAGVGSVLRYHGTTGEFLSMVATGFTTPLGIAVAADGTLFTASQGTNEVYRTLDGVTSVFVTAGSGGLDRPRNVLIGPDVTGDGKADIYVSSQGSSSVLRYNGVTGAFIDKFASVELGSGPAWIDFAPDGDLVASGQTTSSCCERSFVRFNGTTGAKIDQLDTNIEGWSFKFGPDGLIYKSGNSHNFVDRIGPSSLLAFTVSLSYASDVPVTVSYSTANGTAEAGADYQEASGTLTFAPGQTTRSILIPTYDDATYEGNETMFVNLSNPVGAIIADSQGVGTIIDNDSTKFYVVDDGSPDRTYEYGASGNAVENYSLDSGNTRPRGAASNLAGDKVWVVDANKKVYVYNDAGGLLGSWTANSLASNATVEGIATNGTDIWIVDARQDRVYRYANAATRLSGSQSATSSFALNSGNRSPKDIVTDGVNLWVVNDTTTDKVFKYTVSGSLVGSWTINAGGGKPTGITLDPSGGSQSLWIVDSASDRVYEYANSRAKNSGSQSAAASFALAAGNTNPQGIADPPPQLAPSAALSSSIRLDSRPTSNPSAPILHLGWNSPATTRAVEERFDKRLDERQSLNTLRVDHGAVQSGAAKSPVRSATVPIPLEAPPARSTPIVKRESTIDYDQALLEVLAESIL